MDANALISWMNSQPLPSQIKQRHMSIRKGNRNEHSNLCDHWRLARRPVLAINRPFLLAGQVHEIAGEIKHSEACGSNNANRSEERAEQEIVMKVEQWMKEAAAEIWDEAQIDVSCREDDVADFAKTIASHVPVTTERVNMPRESIASILGRIVADKSIPSGTLYAISPRKQVLGLNGYEPESVEEWAKRCFYIVNIGQ